MTFSTSTRNWGTWLVWVITKNCQPTLTTFLTKACSKKVVKQLKWELFSMDHQRPARDTHSMRLCTLVLNYKRISLMFCSSQDNLNTSSWPISQQCSGKFWCILMIDICNYSFGPTQTSKLTRISNTVTYGTRSAPFLSVRVLLQLVEDEGHNYPLAIDPLTKGRYGDDIRGGADTEEELTQVAHQVNEICASGCFPLAKWHSNSLALLQ